MKKLIALTIATAFILFAYGCVKDKHSSVNDFPPTVMVDGKIYVDTGKEVNPKENTSDGKISSRVAQSEKPNEDNQSNFGTGYDYHFCEDGNLEINIDGKWYVFEYEPTEEIITLKIVDKDENNNLILAGENSHDVFSLNTNDVGIYFDDEKTDSSVLNLGMKINVTYGGYILETFPSMLDSVTKIEVSSKDDIDNNGYFSLAQLYLDVLNDIYAKDEGLNSGIKYVSIDLSRAPGNLTDSEKNAIAWLFSSSIDKECLTLSYNELIKEGYLSKYNDADDLYEWEDGILISITSSDKSGNFSLNTVSFDAEKWRSPLGSYVFKNCTAAIPDGIEVPADISYSIEAEMIS